MAINLESIKRNVDAEQKGEWKDSFMLPGVKYKVRSLNNPDYRRARQHYERRVQLKFGANPVNPEWQDREFGKLVAAHLLVDWDGFEQQCTPELAQEVLSDPGYRDMVNDVVGCARSVGDADLEATEEDAKNSGTASSGRQAGGKA